MTRLKNIFVPLLSLALLFATTTTILALTPPLPTPTPPRPTSSYELFWPIVAGKLPNDPLYFLKSFKEQISLILSFDSLKKSDLYLELSKKRLVETEALINQSNLPLAAQTIEKSALLLENSVQIIKQTNTESSKLNEIKQRIIREGDNELYFLNLLTEKLHQDEQAPFQDASEKFKQSLENLK